MFYCEIDSISGDVIIDIGPNELTQFLKNKKLKPKKKSNNTLFIYRPDIVYFSKVGDFEISNRDRSSIESQRRRLELICSEKYDEPCMELSDNEFKLHLPLYVLSDLGLIEIHQKLDPRLQLSYRPPLTDYNFSNYLEINIKPQEKVDSLCDNLNSVKLRKELGDLTI